MNGNQHGQDTNKIGNSKSKQDGHRQKGGITDFPASPHPGGGAAIRRNRGWRAPPGWEEGLSPTQRLRERIQEDTRARKKRDLGQKDGLARSVQSTLRRHWGGSRPDLPEVEPKEPERTPPPLLQPTLRDYVRQMDSSSEGGGNKLGGAGRNPARPQSEATPLEKVERK